MYSQFYPADLDKWKIWQVQTDSKPTEDYVSMDDNLDDALIEGAQELAVEKPVEDVAVEDERVDVVVEDATEEVPPAADVSMQTDEALKVLANVLTSKSLGKANPSSGEYFYLH